MARGVYILGSGSNLRLPILSDNNAERVSISLGSGEIYHAFASDDSESRRHFSGLGLDQSNSLNGHERY